MEQEKTIIALMVENNAGVLSRIAMLFGRRGFNIDSLTVSETNDPGISRITITTTGDDRIINQIILQTRKLVEVLAVRVENPSNAIQRELLLLKLRTKETDLTKIHEVCSIYKADIVDLSENSLIIELTGKPSKIDAFLSVLKKYEIIEQCRTGVTTIERGEEAFTYECKERHNA
jgi:acetolactate synthase I/III small subunit